MNQSVFFYHYDISATCTFQCSIIPPTALAILFHHHGNMVEGSEGSIKFVARPSSRSNSLSLGRRGHPLFRSRSAECVCVWLPLSVPISGTRLGRGGTPEKEGSGKGGLHRDAIKTWKRDSRTPTFW